MDRDSTPIMDDSASLHSEGGAHAGDLGPAADGETFSGQALLVEQGRHRFFSTVLPSDLLAHACVVEPRNENPIDGFQRLLDERRARAIAK